MSDTYTEAADSRFLAQERLLDALLRVLALRDPDILDALKNVLVDTALTHSGTPDENESVQQQIRRRLVGAREFAASHGGGDR